MPATLWAGQVVHYHDIARRQIGHQHLLDIGAEGSTMHRAVEQHGRCDAVKAQAGGEGRCLPVTMRNGRPAPFAFGRPAAKASHLGVGAGLIDKDQARRVKLGLAVEPGASPGKDVRALLFRCMACLFLCVSPRLEKKYHTVAAQARTSRSDASRSAIS